MFVRHELRVPTIIGDIRELGESRDILALEYIRDAVDHALSKLKDPR